MAASTIQRCTLALGLALAFVVGEFTLVLMMGPTIHPTWRTLMLLSLYGLAGGFQFVTAGYSVLGPGPLWLRWTAAWCSTALHHGAIVQTMYYVGNERLRLAAVVALVMPALFLASQVPYALLHIWRNWRMGRIELADSDELNRRPQFGIGRLLTLMLIVAGCLALVQFSIRLFTHGVGGERGIPPQVSLQMWVSLLITCGVIAFYCLIVGAPCFGSVLAMRNPLRRTALTVVALAGTLLILSFGLYVVLTLFDNTGSGPPFWLFVLSMTAPHGGLLASVLILSLALRLLGFRLIAGQSSSSLTTGETASALPKQP